MFSREEEIKSSLSQELQKEGKTKKWKGKVNQTLTVIHAW